jgi:hypothetical protein
MRLGRDENGWKEGILTQSTTMHIRKMYSTRVLRTNEWRSMIGFRQNFGDGKSRMKSIKTKSQQNGKQFE